MTRWKGKNIPDPAPRLFGKQTNQLHRGDFLHIAGQFRTRSTTVPHQPELLHKLIYLIRSALYRFTLDDLYQMAEILGGVSPVNIEGSVELYQFAEACNLVGHRIEKMAGRAVTIAFDPLSRKNEALIMLSVRHPDVVSVYPDRDHSDLIIVRLEIPPTFGLHVPAEIFNRNQSL
ncbi:MAG: hypothetical protein WC693_03085 [Patescibacteria group bacterium]|jgi:hypothetical protein